MLRRNISWSERYPLKRPLEIRCPRDIVIVSVAAFSLSLFSCSVRLKRSHLICIKTYTQPHFLKKNIRNSWAMASLALSFSFQSFFLHWTLRNNLALISMLSSDNTNLRDNTFSNLQLRATKKEKQQKSFIKQNAAYAKSCLSRPCVNRDILITLLKMQKKIAHIIRETTVLFRRSSY